MPSAAADSTTLLVTFSIRGTLFALTADAVQEVIRLPTVTPVRHSPPEVVGVINLRGRIVTLLEAGLILGLPAQTPTPDSRILVMEESGEYFGLLVDRVGEVMDAPLGEAEDLPPNIPDAQARFFDGVRRSSGRVVTVIRPTELLSGLCAEPKRGTPS